MRAHQTRLVTYTLLTLTPWLAAGERLTDDRCDEMGLSLEDCLLARASQTRRRTREQRCCPDPMYPELAWDVFSNSYSCFSHAFCHSKRTSVAAGCR